MSAEAAESTDAPELRWLGHRPYEPLWREMQAFTDSRDGATRDEIWLAEHPPVFTLGLAASPAHVIAPGAIPVIAIDRGGEVTYHGPGQLMVYPMIDVRRARIGVRELVTALEASVIDLCGRSGVRAVARRDAPGVYVDGAKLASVGLRIRRGASYHGMAVNVDMDLEPFERINPCGFENLEMTDLARLGIRASVESLGTTIGIALSERLGLGVPRGISAAR